MKKVLFTLVLILLSMLASAQNKVEIDGIYYNLLSGRKAAVTWNPDGYSGDIIIPESFRYNGYDFSVIRIEEFAFSQCEGLTSISIPNSVVSILDNAFSNCSGLTSVIIGSGVIKIVGNAFYGCSGLTSIKVDSGNSQFDSRDNCNAIIETASNTLIVGCQNTTIPVTVSTIGDLAFGGCSSLTSIIIPDGVTCIGKSAFTYCSGLTSVSIGNGVTSIGDNAFFGCSGLISVTIPDGVTSIGKDAFFFCFGLTSVTIGSGVVSIGVSAFPIYSGLSDVYCYAEEVPKTDEFPFWPFSYDHTTIDMDNVTLHVPVGSIEAYKTAWFFRKIVAIEGGVEPEKGDLSGDDMVDASDLVTLVNMIAAGDGSAVGDLNGDGKVDIADVIVLVNIITGK